MNGIEFVPHLAVTRVASNVRIRRERILPIPGEVTGATGIRVGAQDIVGRAFPPKMRRALSLTRVLGVTEAEVPRRLLKQVGDPVDAREIIIAKPINLGIERLVYRSPGAGQITAIQGSWMILDLFGPPLDLPALYRGTLVEIRPCEGVVIEAQGALIQGAWGSGVDAARPKEAVGEIKLMVTRADEVLEANGINEFARGALLVAGAGVTAAALERATQFQAAGIITGGLVPQLRQLAVDAPFPVLVTEGFGKVPMSAPVFDLLTTLNGREAALNARWAPRGRQAARPELFAPLLVSRMLEADQAAVTERPVAQPRAVVRGTCPPYLGQIGTLPDELQLFWLDSESGAQLAGTLVEWQRTPGKYELVPWVNLELIG